MIERAFEVFDADNKGFISKEDLSRVMSSTGVNLDEKEKKAIMDMQSGGLAARQTMKKLELTSFADLMSNLKTAHFAKNQHIFKEGEKGDRMYFINSGKAKVTVDGMKLGTLGQGDFFGEGSMLEPTKRRSATVTALTPVEVMEIPKHDYDRYIKDAMYAKNDLTTVRNSRMLLNAKNLIRLQKNLVYHKLQRGEHVFQEGDEVQGGSMYMVAETDDDRKSGGSATLKVTRAGVEVDKLKSGDMFGEVSLLLNKPRSITVTCDSPSCPVLEMKGADFMSLVDNSPFVEFKLTLQDLSRRKEFRRALNLNGARNKSGSTLKELFDAADVDKDGKLSFSEVKNVLQKFDETFPEEDIIALVRTMDLKGSGFISWEEFERVVGLDVR